MTQAIYGSMVRERVLEQGSFHFFLTFLEEKSIESFKLGLIMKTKNTNRKRDQRKKANLVTREKKASWQQAVVVLWGKREWFVVLVFVV